jgi:hypothetical protein
MVGIIFLFLFGFFGWVLFFVMVLGMTTRSRRVKNCNSSWQGTVKAGGKGSTELAMLYYGHSSHPAILDKLHAGGNLSLEAWTNA